MCAQKEKKERKNKVLSSMGNMIQKRKHNAFTTNYTPYSVTFSILVRLDLFYMHLKCDHECDIHKNPVAVNSFV